MILPDIQCRIGVPPNTPLKAIFMVNDNWHIWIAVRDMQVPYTQWQGTYMCLTSTGHVTRHTVYDDGLEKVMIIR